MKALVDPGHPYNTECDSQQEDYWGLLAALVTCSVFPDLVRTRLCTCETIFCVKLRLKDNKTQPDVRFLYDR